MIGNGVELSSHDFENESTLVVGFEGVAEGAQFVEDAAEGPDVALVVVGLLFAKLGRQVVGCANNGVGHVVGLGEALGDSEVSDLDLVGFAEEHVDGLDISVEDLEGVQVVEAQRHLDEKLPNLVLAQAPAHLLLEELTDVAVFAELHDDVDGVGVRKGVVVPAHVLAVDLRQNGCLQGCLSLLLETHRPSLDRFQHVDFLVDLPPHLVDHAE